MNKKGNAVAFLAVVLIMILAGAIYIIMRQATDLSIDAVNSTAFTYVGGDYEDSVLRLQSMWYWTPIIVLFTLLLYFIIQSKKRDYAEV